MRICAARKPAGTATAAQSTALPRGLRLGVTYQPASRYWPSQGAETGIYLALALALIGYCFRRVDRLP